VAFALVAIYQCKIFELWWLLDYFFTALVIAWLSAFQWALMCLLMDLVENKTNIKFQNGQEANG
jgi:hypothetical protein